MIPETFETQLSALKSAIGWPKAHLTELSLKIETLKIFRLRPFREDHWGKIYSLWYELLSKIPLPKTEIDVNYIVRARTNEQVPFTEEWELSYNTKNTDKIGWGRFNCPKQSYFYGAVPIVKANHEPTSSDQQFIMSSTLEACKDITNESCSIPYFDLTVGIWALKNPLVVINLCYDSKHLETNPRWEGGLNQLIEGIKMVGSTEDFELITSFWQLMSNCSCIKNPSQQDYLISSALFNAIGNYYAGIGEIVSGLSYPSAMTDNQGQNVVLTKKAVDEYLFLNEVFMYRYHRQENERAFCVYPISDITKVLDKNFIISKHSNDKTTTTYQDILKMMM